MFSPTVTELPRRLEPVSRDTFLDARRPVLTLVNTGHRPAAELRSAV